MATEGRAPSVDDTGGGFDVTGRFSSEVELALAEVLPSDDPLDQPDFDPIEYINSRFPNEASLALLDEFIDEVDTNLESTESKLLEAVQIQAQTASSAARDLQTAKGAVETLHERVTDIRSKAEASENMVASICDSIRHLDTAKSNLGTSIRTLQDLQSYIACVQALGEAADRDDYASCDEQLRSAQEFRTKFSAFSHTPKVRELATQLDTLEVSLNRSLRNYIILELSASAAAASSDGGGAKPTKVDEARLRSACQALDALGPEPVKDARAEFIKTQLQPYSTLFQRGRSEAVLEKAERRFAYIRKVLEVQSRVFLHVFPRHWCVAQELCVDFCLKTHDDLAFQLREESAVDIAILVFALQRTIEVERELTQRMRKLQQQLDDQAAAVSPPDPASAGGAEDLDDLEFDAPVKRKIRNRDGTEAAALPEYKYVGMVVSAFDAHMDRYVMHEDRMLETTVAENVANDSVADEQLTLQSAQDLFLYIQDSKHRASSFAQARTLGELARVWLKHLVRYAELVAESIRTVPKADDEFARYCVVVNTADYCRVAAEGLAEDLTRLLDGDVDELKPIFDAVPDAFVALSSAVNKLLVEGICVRLGEHISELQSFLATQASSNDHAHSAMDAVDESPASHAIQRTYRAVVELAARHLHPHCFPYLLNKTAATFIPAQWGQSLVFRPRKPHTDLSLSQLRIDCDALERVFMQVPTEVIKAAGGSSSNAAGGGGAAGGGAAMVGGAPTLTTFGPSAGMMKKPASRASVLGSVSKASSADAPRVVLTAYQRTVKREAGYLSATLKILHQGRLNEGFADLYYAAMPAERRSLADCSRLLELKGVKPDEQRQFLAELRRHVDVPRDDTFKPASAATTSSGGAPSQARGANTSESPSRFNFLRKKDEAGNSSGAAASGGGRRTAGGAGPTSPTVDAADDGGAGDDGPGTALSRKFREMRAEASSSIMSRLKRSGQQ